MRLRSAAALLLALPCALQARDEGGWRGMHAQAVFAEGDLKPRVSDSPGLGLGFHYAYELGSNRALRPRLDYLVFDSPKATEEEGELRRPIKALNWGVDYLQFLRSGHQGAYLIVGASMTSWWQHQPGSSTSTKPSFSGGLGYQFDAPLGLEVRYVFCRFSSRPDLPSTFNSLQAGLTYKF